MGAVGVATAILLLGGCGQGSQGVREEGPAENEPVAAPSPTDPSRALSKKDAAEIVKRDPRVSLEVRERLRPCPSKEPEADYPIDVSYGRVTGGAGPDVVINITTCGEALGLGSYVYRVRGPGYEGVFANEDSPVYAKITNGELQVTKPLYASGDEVCCPSGEEVTTYTWQHDRFAQVARTKAVRSKGD